jgi:hypothetical protein
MATTQADIQTRIKNVKEFSDEKLEITESLRKDEIAEEIKQSSEDDLESLLKLAEELKEKVGKPEKRIRSLRFLQLVIIFMSIISYFSFQLFWDATTDYDVNNFVDSKMKEEGNTIEKTPNFDNNQKYYFTKRWEIRNLYASEITEIQRGRGIEFNSFIMLFVVFSTLILLFLEFYIRKTKPLNLPDKLALKEVLQLLREVHGTIAEREDWSILKRAEFRIRLSRFDLSEKKESVFSFFN